MSEALPNEHFNTSINHHLCSESLCNDLHIMVLTALLVTKFCSLSILVCDFNFLRFGISRCHILLFLLFGFQFLFFIATLGFTIHCDWMNTLDISSMLQKERSSDLTLSRFVRSISRCLLILLQFSRLLDHS